MSLATTTVSHQTHDVQDGQSYTIWFTLVDEVGVPVGTDRLTTAALTLIDERTRKVINGRLNQNVINLNDVAIGASDGRVQWDLRPLDNALQRQTAREWHIATFSFTWDAGLKAFDHQVYLHVSALEPV